MTETKRESVTITGSGKIGGGVYDVIKVMGSARVSGDVEANTIRTAGSASFSGSVDALHIHNAGNLRIAEDVSTGSFKSAGSSTVDGDLRATHFSCSGSQRVGNDLIAGNVRLSGSCNVSNDVEADEFVSKGRFRIGGLLSADDIRIQLGHGRGGQCVVSEIGGERIEVRSKGPFWDYDQEKLERKLGKVGHKLEKGLTKMRGKFGIEIDLGDIDKMVDDIVKVGEKIKVNIESNFEDDYLAMLEVETIEGDDIYLEYTKASVVRGKKIAIGPGCEIDHVEYSDSLEIDEDAHVVKQDKF